MQISSTIINDHTNINAKASNIINNTNIFAKINKQLQLKQVSMQRSSKHQFKDHQQI